MDAIWNLHNVQHMPMAEHVDTAVEVAPESMPQPDLSVNVQDDGSVIVDLNPEPQKQSNNHEDNLAMILGHGELSSIAETLLEGIDTDLQSREEWLAIRAKGMDLLALKLEDPKGDVGQTSAPVEGMSTVRHPLLLEAVLTAWSNARGELLPANGPVKVVDNGKRSNQRDILADQLERDLNFYLTKKAKEYYPDTDRLLLMTVFGGSGFKKVYMDPMRRRPVSESVDASDLIVNNAATDLRNAGRITHKITMRPSVLKRMKILGVYRDTEPTTPTPTPDVVERKEASIEGIRLDRTLPDEQDYTIYECYCELDLDQFAPKQFKGKGLPLPYRVTIDRDSRQVLEIRRNWREDDEDCDARTTFVHYPYIRGFGLYGWGLLHLLGNSTSALTAAWREALDAGMFANFPGFLIAKLAARQQTNEMRVPAGGSVVVDTQGQPIQNAVMPLPYKDVSAGLLGMMDKVAAAAQRVGGITEVKIGEGKQETPVGTTLALIEQATKVESAIHKNMHQAQSEEFELIVDLFRDNPESFWRGNRRPATQWDKDKFEQALNLYGINPVADPNTPSHLHRIMKATALKQLQAASPALYDARAVDEQVLRMIGFDDAESLFAPPQPPVAAPPDPKMANVQFQATAKAAELQQRAQIKMAELEDKDKERKLKAELAMVDLARTLAVHPEAEKMAERTLAKSSGQLQ
jgi:hypothetical protein